MSKSRVVSVLLAGVLLFMLICPAADAFALPKQNSSGHDCMGEKQQDSKEGNQKDQKAHSCCSQQAIPVHVFHAEIAGIPLFVLQPGTAFEDFPAYRVTSTLLALSTDRHLAKLSLLRI